MFHILISGTEPLASLFDVNLFKEYTPYGRWPASVLRQTKFFTSQILIVLSLDPLANRFSSIFSRQCMPAGCPNKVSTHSFEVMFHIWIKQPKVLAISGPPFNLKLPNPTSWITCFGLNSSNFISLPIESNSLILAWNSLTFSSCWTCRRLTFRLANRGL